MFAIVFALITAMAVESDDYEVQYSWKADFLENVEVI